MIKIKQNHKIIFYVWGYYAYAIRNNLSLSKHQISTWIDEQPFGQQLKRETSSRFYNAWKTGTARKTYKILKQLTGTDWRDKQLTRKVN